MSERITGYVLKYPADVPIDHPNVQIYTPEAKGYTAWAFDAAIEMIDLIAKQTGYRPGNFALHERVVMKRNLVE